MDPFIWVTRDETRLASPLPVPLPFFAFALLASLSQTGITHLYVFIWMKATADIRLLERECVLIESK